MEVGNEMGFNVTGWSPGILILKDSKKLSSFIGHTDSAFISLYRTKVEGGKSTEERYIIT